jgi:hypothetical protein
MPQLSCPEIESVFYSFLSPVDFFSENDEIIGMKEF